MTIGSAVDRLADRTLRRIAEFRHRIPHRTSDIVYAVLVVGLFGFLAYSLRSQWFILDEFDYVQPPSGDSWIGWLFAPHNEHTIVFTKLWFSTLFQLFGLRHYWLYAIPMVLAHALAYAAVVRITGFASGDRRFARFATLPLVVMAAGAGTLLWGGQLQYTGAVAAGLWLLWFSIRPIAPAPWLVALLAVLGTFSGSAFIAFGLASAAVFLVRRRAMLAIISAGAPAAWFVIERVVWPINDAYQVHSVGQFLGSAPSFVFALLDRAITDTTRIPSVAAALCLGVVVGVIAVMARGWTRTSKVAAVLGLASALSLLVTVIGRLGRNVDDAASGGYSYFIVILAFPALLLLIYALVPARSTIGILVILSLGLSAADVAGYQGASSSYAQWRQGTERILEGAAYRIAHGQTGVSPVAVPDAGGSPTVTWKRLSAWTATGKIDTLRPDAATAQQLELATGVVSNTVAQVCTTGSVITPDADSRALPAGGAYLSAVGAAAATVTLAIADDGPTRTLTIGEGATVQLGFRALEIRMAVTAGAVRVCRLN